jgi:DNA-binding MarR family transcriptional regulator
MEINMAASEKIDDQFVQLFQHLMRLRPKIFFPDEHVASLHEQARSIRNSTGNPEDRIFLFRILDIVTHSETPPTMGELSAKLGIPLSSATRMADGLVDAKFVERCADPHDRRVVRLGMTKNGQQFIQAGMLLMKERISQLLKHLSSDEQKQLLRLINKVIDSIEAEKVEEQAHATL